MDLFVSWSGGKDCMLAMYRILKASDGLDHAHQVKYLINMCDTGDESRSHGLKKHLIEQQALALGIELLQPTIGPNSYETHFKAAIKSLKEKGVTGGIFGDIYLQAHRDWIEKVCLEMEIVPFFPLWKNDTKALVNEFIESGFKTILVSVNSDHLPKTWLGREIDQEFVSDILKIEGIDACAENGEYHSFVYDGPIFSQKVPFVKENEYFKDNHWFLNLI